MEEVHHGQAIVPITPVLTAVTAHTEVPTVAAVHPVAVDPVVTEAEADIVKIFIFSNRRNSRQLLNNLYILTHYE